MSRIKVMIVDDSAVVRQVLVELLGDDSGIECDCRGRGPIVRDATDENAVAGCHCARRRNAANGRCDLPAQAHAGAPDTVVICSTLTEAGAPTTIEALAAGAVTVITKPKIGLKQFLNEAAHELVAAVRAAARANVSASLAAWTGPLPPE